MKRLSSFVAGVVVGVVLATIMLKYHIVRAEQGTHWIPKAAPTFSAFYVDIREFSVEDWQAHSDLALAIAKSGNRELLNQAAQQSLRQTAQSWLEGLGR